MLSTIRTIALKNLQSRSKFNRLLKQVECLNQVDNRLFHNTVTLKCRKEVNANVQGKSVALFDAAQYQKKEKDTFLDVIHTYTKEQQRKTGHVRFVYAALRYMEEFGVHEDLEAYKAILDTIPKGRYVASTLFQAEMMHYPREQQCIIDLLQQMEDNAVVPDPEFETMVINVTGEYGVPLRKFRRMTYWQGKFKNLNPWPVPRPLPSDSLAIAKLAIEKIASIDVQSQITVFQSKDIIESIDKTWIVSASSPDQERLIALHPTNVPAYVEGPYRIWVDKSSVDYFLLYTDPINRAVEEEIDMDDLSNIDISFWKKSKNTLILSRCIHEQDKMTIFGVCATGTSTKDSLLSWIRFLQAQNPTLETIPILFKFISREDPQQIESGIKDDKQEIKKIKE